MAGRRQLQAHLCSCLWVETVILPHDLTNWGLSSPPAWQDSKNGCFVLSVHLVLVKRIHRDNGSIRMRVTFMYSSITPSPPPIWGRLFRPTAALSNVIKEEWGRKKGSWRKWLKNYAVTLIAAGKCTDINKAQMLQMGRVKPEWTLSVPASSQQKRSVHNFWRKGNINRPLKVYSGLASFSIASPWSGPELNLHSFGVNQTERLSYGSNKDELCEPLQKQLTWLLPDLEWNYPPPHLFLFIFFFLPLVSLQRTGTRWWKSQVI